MRTPPGLNDYQAAASIISSLLAKPVSDGKFPYSSWNQCIPFYMTSFVDLLSFSVTYDR